MSSRKSIRRLSSKYNFSSKSTNKDNNITKMDYRNYNTHTTPVILSLVIICYHLLVLGYLLTLEGKECNCIMDWRHNFLKYYSIIMIFFSLFLLMISGNTKLYQNGIFQVIQILLMIAFLINVWCLYTYIGDLEATYCKCATEQQKDVHYFLYIWRYILVASIVISLIMILLGAVFNNGK